MFFLNYLFRKLRQVPVLVAATIQEEQLSDYSELADLMAEWSAAGHVTLTVVPLERAHVGEYVRMMAATRGQADESIVDRLFRLTGGNPFFLREAVSLITGSPGSPLALRSPRPSRPRFPPWSRPWRLRSRRSGST